MCGQPLQSRPLSYDKVSTAPKISPILDLHSGRRFPYIMDHCDSDLVGTLFEGNVEFCVVFWTEKEKTIRRIGCTLKTDIG